MHESYFPQAGSCYQCCALAVATIIMCRCLLIQTSSDKQLHHHHHSHQTVQLLRAPTRRGRFLRPASLSVFRRHLIRRCQRGIEIEGGSSFLFLGIRISRLRFECAQNFAAAAAFCWRLLCASFGYSSVFLYIGILT